MENNDAASASTVTSPPSKKARLDAIKVTLGDESFSIAANVFQKLESFMTDKISTSDKKSR